MEKLGGHLAEIYKHFKEFAKVIGLKVKEAKTRYMEIKIIAVVA